jgi:plasmid stabilization system protein ParE
MKVTILESAKQDLREGFDFYESQATGIGSYFLESLFSDIESLRLFAGVHGVHFGRYHRLLSRRFPFAVYYRIEEDQVRVYAVLDCRRDPAWIRKRLQ